jgi:hypothetical protein
MIVQLLRQKSSIKNSVNFPILKFDLNDHANFNKVLSKHLNDIVFDKMILFCLNMSCSQDKPKNRHIPREKLFFLGKPKKITTFDEYFNLQAPGATKSTSNIKTLWRKSCL